MIIQTKKVFPLLNPIASVLFYLWLGFMINDYNGWKRIILVFALSFLFLMLAEIYKGIKVDTEKRIVHYGIGWYKLFRANKTYEKAAIKSIGIYQLEDLYYGIQLELKNRERITLKKIATLDKATEEFNQLSAKLEKAWE